MKNVVSRDDVKTWWNFAMFLPASNEKQSNIEEECKQHRTQRSRVQNYHSFQSSSLDGALFREAGLDGHNHFDGDLRVIWTWNC